MVVMLKIPLELVWHNVGVMVLLIIHLILVSKNVLNILLTTQIVYSLNVSLIVLMDIFQKRLIELVLNNVLNRVSLGKILQRSV